VEHSRQIGFLHSTQQNPVFRSSFHGQIEQRFFWRSYHQNPSFLFTVQKEGKLKELPTFLLILTLEGFAVPKFFYLTGSLLIPYEFTQVPYPAQVHRLGNTTNGIPLLGLRTQMERHELSMIHGMVFFGCSDWHRSFL